jgi:hydrogenase maturation protein HypF
MTRLRIVVRGVVQGVGFRPFVYNLARAMGGRGYVKNTSGGVLIEFEGDSPERFVTSLKSDCPPLARIHELAVDQLPCEGFADFTIIESVDEGAFTHVSPDTSVCDDCLSEMWDPADRRYLYPFINCTNCGPRYTITRQVPYDRPNTTMSAFTMCPACAAEYHDPSSRRFHAQPNACPVCGPRVTLRCSSTAFDLPDTTSPIEGTIALLKRGAIVAIKGLGGFHLCCDAANADAVARLRERKRRRNKPFALMAPHIEAVGEFCEIAPEEREMLRDGARPIVLLRKRRSSLLPEQLAPKNSYLGWMLPYTPLHYLVFFYPTHRHGPHAPHFACLVMTSGNLAEEPIVIDNADALHRLSGTADAYLLHNRDIFMRVDDSVVSAHHAQVAHPCRERGRCASFVRRSRGFAPAAIPLAEDGPEVLGCGADIKNTFTITKGEYAIVSQHIGDMENFETLSFFEETLENLKQVYRAEPVAIAHDLHPGYLSSRWAERHCEKAGLARHAVQHHHAHIAAVMAEHGLRGPVIGVALDGSGYGTDGALWGSEFLVSDLAGFSRLGHFRYIPLPGGESAIREGWRTAVGLLGQVLRGADGTQPAAASGRSCGRSLWKMLESLGFVERHGSSRIEHILKVAGNRAFSPLSSGAGRFFDAVAAMAGLCDRNTFEGEAAIALESVMNRKGDGAYPFDIGGEGILEVDFSPMVLRILDEINSGAAVSEISLKFHNAIADAVLAVVDAIGRQHALRQVALSGGVFQNAYLLERVTGGLSEKGFHVYVHDHLPCNDGCISLGQAVVLREQLRVP